VCTLTVVPTAAGARLAFNRDEQRARPPALPPARRRFGAREAVLPTDPASGGTWLAVNDAGLTLALLNGNPPAPSASRPRRSRGDLVPGLLDLCCPAEALAAAGRRFDHADFAPYRLVLVGDGVAADLRWDGHHPMVMTRLIGGRPLLFTSSGLGDHLVEGPRQDLFDTLFAAPPAEWADVQDAFHRHRWPGREHLSVNMARADARTVSHAVVELAEAAARFDYRPDFETAPVTLHLAYAPAGAV
jgi:hypothetical protein